MKRTEPEAKTFEDFYKMVERNVYNVKDIELLLSYVDPHDNDLLPINNDDNFVRALTTAKPLLRLIIQRKGKFCWAIFFRVNSIINGQIQF